MNEMIEKNMIDQNLCENINENYKIINSIINYKIFEHEQLDMIHKIMKQFDEKMKNLHNI